MTTASRPPSSWTSRLLVVLLLLIAGAAGATWGLARWDDAARFLGVAPARPEPPAAMAWTPAPASGALPARPQPDPAAAETARIAALEARLEQVEDAARTASGSAGRADALLVAFAARRAIDRGVALGYLETLLVERFGSGHPRAVATIISASRDPVRLDQLDSEYELLGTALKAAAPGEDWLTGLRRELGSLVAIRKANRPSSRPAARFERARARLAAGQVDAALAETMRLPGAARASGWIDRARHYIAAHRALDEIESAALLGRANGPR